MLPAPKINNQPSALKRTRKECRTKFASVECSFEEIILGVALYSYMLSIQRALMFDIWCQLICTIQRIQQVVPNKSKLLDISPVCRHFIDIMEMNKWHAYIPANEFDYAAIMGALKDYRRPRDKMTTLLRHGEIVRIKKGIYILGTGLRQGAISREVLGNLIYGPSYISLEYALSAYQLIPERVETVTSVTMHKTKSFDTPLGKFIYRNVKTAYYAVGQTINMLSDGRGYLIACPEKAIADMVYFCSGLRNIPDIEAHLFSNLRIDREDFIKLELPFFQELKDIENRNSLKLLAELARSYE